MPRGDQQLLANGGALRWAVRQQVGDVTGNVFLVRIVTKTQKAASATKKKKKREEEAQKKGGK